MLQAIKFGINWPCGSGKEKFCKWSKYFSYPLFPCRGHGPPFEETYSNLISLGCNYILCSGED